MENRKTKSRKLKNIILIGMPGCGKSTVGIVLAKQMGYGFLDSDLLIQAREHRLLSEIINEEGLDAFNKIEEDVNSSIVADRCVIATGGSVIYGPKAMEHLRSIGTVIYLRLSFSSIEDRLGDLHARGVSVKEGQTLLDLYQERIPLYEKYAHLTIDAENMRIREVVKEISRQLKMRRE